MDSKSIERGVVRTWMRDHGVEDALVVNNPTGRYYLLLAKAVDADNKGREVAILRTLPSGKLFVMDVRLVEGKVKVNGKEMDRFSPAMDDDAAIDATIGYIMKGDEKGDKDT